MKVERRKTKQILTRVKKDGELRIDRRENVEKGQ